MTTKHYLRFARFSTFITIIFLPSLYNPISIPKFSALIGFLGFVIFVYLNTLFQRPRNFLDWIPFFFIFSMLGNLFFNHNAIDERLFGVSGRNIGFFSLFAFACLLQVIGRIPFSFIGLRNNILISNLAVSIILVVQTLFPNYFDFELYYGVAPSTLGNPNIIAAFLGVSFLSVISWYVDSKTNKPLRVSALVLVIVINFWALYECNSVQGVVILICTLWSYWFLSKHFLRPKRALIAILGSLFIVFSATLFLVTSNFFGMARFAESTSFFSRMDYWRAGWKMFIHQPIFGVGLDGYGDFYRAFRDVNAYLRFGEGRITDSAHNVYLDFFANGGVALGVAFVLLNLMPFYVLIKSIYTQNRGRVNQINFLLAFWVGFQITLILSVNNIPLLVWLSLLLGSMKSLVFHDKGYELKSTNSFKTNSRLRKSLIGTLLCLLLVVSFVPLKLSFELLKAANASDGSKLVKLMSHYPRDSKYFIQVAKGAAAAGFFRESLEVSIKGLTYNPRNFELHRIVFENPLSTDDIRENSLIKMKELDPNYDFTTQIKK